MVCYSLPWMLWLAGLVVCYVRDQVSPGKVGLPKQQMALHSVDYLVVREPAEKLQDLWKPEETLDEFHPSSQQVHGVILRVRLGEEVTSRFARCSRGARPRLSEWVREGRPRLRAGPVGPRCTVTCGADRTSTRRRRRRSWGSATWGGWGPEASRPSPVHRGTAGQAAGATTVPAFCNKERKKYVSGF